MAEDYYSTLGIKRDASQADIQKAYREMARKYHPDMNPDDKRAKEKFQKIQAAYDVLNDPEKREMYDRYGSSFETMGGGPGGGWRTTRGTGPEAFDELDFSELFSGRGGAGPGGFADIFKQFTEAGGRAGGRRSARRGVDLEYELQVPFHTAITGGEVSIAVQRPDGTSEHIQVKIPPGIDDGKKIRLRGQGAPPARGGQPGDLLITVHVAPHPCYHRRGQHLEVRVPVTLAEATLGAKIDIPTPKGTISVTVPAGSSSGRRLRLKGLGVRTRNGQVGDLFVELMIVVPESLDAASADLVRQLDKRWRLNPRSDLAW